MLFPHRLTIRPIGEPKDDTSSNPKLIPPSGQINWLDRLSNAEFKPGDLRRLVNELLYFSNRVDSLRSPIGWREIDIYNQIVGAYQMATAAPVKRITDAISSGSGLLQAIEPYFASTKSMSECDDADALLALACRIPYSVWSKGQGNCYHATPLRTFANIVEAMSLKATDRVMELGGVGLTTVAGSHFSNAHWINVEVDKGLHRHAVRLTRLFGRHGRAEAVKADFLHERWPDANCFYVYEPVDPIDSFRLAHRFEERAASGPIKIACFTPTGGVTFNRDVIARRGPFRETFKSPDGQVTIFEC